MMCNIHIAKYMALAAWSPVVVMFAALPRGKVGLSYFEAESVSRHMTVAALVADG
jgi:hypothetical protein